VTSEVWADPATSWSSASVSRCCLISVPTCLNWLCPLFDSSLTFSTVLAVFLKLRGSLQGQTRKSGELGIRLSAIATLEERQK